MRRRCSRARRWAGRAAALALALLGLGLAGGGGGEELLAAALAAWAGDGTGTTGTTGTGPGGGAAALGNGAELLTVPNGSTYPASIPILLSPEPCGPNGPFLLVLVPSAAGHAEQRQAVRDTWGGAAAPKRPGNAPQMAKTAARIRQNAPRMSKNAPETPENALRTPENGPEMPQTAPTTHGNAPKTAGNPLKTPQNGPETPEKAPKKRKNTPEKPENAPETAGNALKTPQNVPKTAGNPLKTPQNAPKTPRNAPEMPQNAAKTAGNALKTPRNDPEMAGNALEMPQNAPEMAGNALKTPQNAAKTAGNALQTPQNAPEMAGNAPKTPQNAPEMAGNALKTPRNSPETAGNAPKTPRNAPETPGDASATPPRAPSTRTVFVLGLPPPWVPAQALREEARRHGDVLQGAFPDAYGTLTVKTLLLLRWAASRCPGARFLLKADDDVFVNVPALARHLRAPALPPRLYLGRVHWWVPPNRDPSSPHHVPAALYPRARFPPYCSGTAYVLSLPAALAVLAAAPHVPFVGPEDVWVGLCARYAGVAPRHSARVAGAMRVPLDGCCYGEVLFSAHRLRPDDMRRVWGVLKEGGKGCGAVGRALGVLRCRAMAAGAGGGW